MKKSKVLSLMTCAAVLSSSFAFVNVINAGTASAASPVTLKWYIIGNGQQKDQAKVDAKINDYLKKKKLNAKVEIQCFDWGTYDNKLKTMIAAGENFDICFTSSWTNNYVNQSMKHAFIPLNKYFKNELKGTAKNLGTAFLNGSAIDGKNYAIPANKEKPHQWGVILLKKYVDKYHFDLSKIKTYSDLEPLFKVIKAKEPGVTPFEAGSGSTCNIMNIMDYDRIGDDGYPGVVTNDTKDYKVFNEYADPKFKKALGVVHKWFKLGYIRQDASTITDVTPDQKAGKTFCSVQSLKPGKDAEMSLSTGQKWVQVALTKPVISNRDTTGSMQAVSATSKHPLEAVKLLELVNTDKYLNNLINYGIEGVHYTKIDANTIKLTPSNAKSGAYNPGTQWATGNQFINYVTTTDIANKWAKFLAFNNSATTTKTLGFIYDPKNVKTEEAQITNVFNKYNTMLVTGTVDPDKYLAEANKAFKAAGMDKVIADKQKQLNAWLKKNGIKK